MQEGDDRNDRSLRAGSTEAVEVGAPQKIVVDGYNVIYADDSLRRHALRDMERARREFLERIKTYLKEKQVQVTVVFDGRGGIADSETIVPGKLHVVYSARNQTADDLIISMISRSSNPQAFLVATSDKAHIRPAVAKLGCSVIGAMGFLKRISQGGSAGPGKEIDEKPKADGADIDYWLSEFEKGEPGGENK